MTNENLKCFVNNCVFENLEISGDFKIVYDLKNEGSFSEVVFNTMLKNGHYYTKNKTIVKKKLNTKSTYIFVCKTREYLDGIIGELINRKVEEEKNNKDFELEKYKNFSIDYLESFIFSLPIFESTSLKKSRFINLKRDIFEFSDCFFDIEKCVFYKRLRENIGVELFCSTISSKNYHVLLKNFDIFSSKMFLDLNENYKYIDSNRNNKMLFENIYKKLKENTEENSKPLFLKVYEETVSKVLDLKEFPIGIMILSILARDKVLIDWTNIYPIVCQNEYRNTNGFNSNKEINSRNFRRFSEIEKLENFEEEEYSFDGILESKIYSDNFGSSKYVLIKV